MWEALEINIVLGTALGYLLAQLVRFLRKRTFWKNVTDSARHYIESPDVPVDDPEAAAKLALLDEQRPQVQAVARELRSSIPPPTSTTEAVTPREVPIVRTPDAE